MKGLNCSQMQDSTESKLNLVHTLPQSCLEGVQHGLHVHQIHEGVVSSQEEKQFLEKLPLVQGMVPALADTFAQPTYPQLPSIKVRPPGAGGGPGIAHLDASQLPLFLTVILDVNTLVQHPDPHEKLGRGLG